MKVLGVFSTFCTVSVRSIALQKFLTCTCTFQISRHKYILSRKKEDPKKLGSIPYNERFAEIYHLLRIGKCRTVH